MAVRFVMTTQLLVAVANFFKLYDYVFSSPSVPLSPTGNHSVDISDAYVQWSQWQRSQVMGKIRKNSRTRNTSRSPSILTTPLPIVGLLETMGTPDFGSESEYMLHVVPQKGPEHQDKKPTFARNVVRLQEKETLHYSDDEPGNIATNSTSTPYSTAGAVILAILTALVSFITIAGNVLVLLSFFVERALRTATNFFIASLAVTDVLIGIFSMNFYTLYLLLGRWPLGRLSCDLWLSLDYTACLTSQYTVLIITADRFFSVRLPAKYRNWRTDRKVIIMVAVTWIVPSSVFFPTIMAWPYFNTNMKPRAQDQCYAEFANDPVFNTIFTVCYFWVTLCVMIGLYVGIYQVADKLQKRSDEKRNRVSGLFANPVRSVTPGTTKTSSGASAGNYVSYSSARQNVPHSSSSLVGANDSSGFDSEEETRKQPTRLNKGLKSLTKQVSTTTTVLTTSPNAQLTTSVRKLHNGDGKKVSSDFVDSHKITAQPKAEIKANTDEYPATVPEPAPQLVSAAYMKTSVTRTNQTESECPLHGKYPGSTIANNPNENNGYTPSSVVMDEADRLHISSPVLTDDDSGLEVTDGPQSHLRRIYFPPSPPLCICADLEEEQAAESAPYLSSVVDSSSAKDQEGHPDNSCEHVNNQTETAIWVGTSHETLSNPETTASRIPPVKPSVDPGYHDRVMEAYRRRMAANNLVTSAESQDSDYVTSSNLSNQPLTSMCKTLHSPQRNTSIRKGSTGNTINEPVPNHKSKREVRCSTSCNGKMCAHESSSLNCLVVNQTGKVSDQSPIWKPQLYSEIDTFSTTCSLHGLVCYDQPVISGCYETKNECVYCSRQPDSDTIHSSSSYADYVGPNLVERRCCGCSIGLSEASQKPVAKKKILNPSIFLLKIRNFHRISLSTLKKTLLLRKTKVPIERGRRENRARKALRTITFILGAFVLCWTPYHVVIIIKGICDDVFRKRTCVNEIFYSVTYWLCYMNSPINPFCYALANAQFKKTFLRIFHGDLRRT
ncbi:unnamed protein product [Dicrocoelium dendriticum]|nr:unnamed protein product [Dicrocoelium dendriticum]